MQLTTILAMCLAAAFINLPFGVYRQGVRRFSWRWFLAIHLPIPLVLALRLTLGLSWQIVPLLFAFAIMGQFAGGKLRMRIAFKEGGRPAQEETGPDPEKTNDQK